MDVTQRYLALFRQAPVMATILDDDGQILDVSDVWAARMGYSREELLGRRPRELASAPSARRIREQYIPRFRETGRLTGLAVEFVTRDGSTFEVFATTTAEYDDGGEFLDNYLRVTRRAKAVVLKVFGG